MAEALIMAKDTNPVTLKGDVIEWRGNGVRYGSKETLPTFIIAKFPDAKLVDMDNQYPIKYRIERRAEKVGWSNGKLQVKVYHDNAGVTIGKATASNLDEYIKDLGVSLVSEADNEVVYEIDPLVTIQSPLFLGFGHKRMPKLNLTFVGVVGGVYTFDLEYGTSGINSSYIERQAGNNPGVTVVSNDGSVLRFGITALGFEQTLKRRVSETAESIAAKYRYHLSTGVVDQIIAARGGVWNTDKATFTAQLIDRKNE